MNLSLKEWAVVVACFMALMIAPHISYGQEAAANATQGQSQGQSQIGGMGSASSDQTQSQGQWNGGAGGAATGGSVSNSGNVRFNNSFNGAEPIRYLPVPSVMPIENYQPAIFGRLPYEDKGPDFISMRQLVHAMNYVDLKAEVTGEKHIRVTTQMLQPLPAGHPKGSKPKAKSSKELRDKMKVKFEINDGQAVNDGFMPIAVLSIETEKPDKSNSASLAMKIGKIAEHMKANTVVFLTEGSTKQVVSSGWGIGFSYNYAQVNSDPSGNGSVGSGGFGYSQGKASYDNLIYLTAIVGTRKVE